MFLGQLLGELRNNKSLTTGESMDSDYSEFVTKQKRKRIRKRKKKNKEINGDTSLNDSSVLIISDFESKPVRSRACPTMHLKFKEDGEFLKVVDVTKKENQKSCTEISSIPNIIIDSDEEGSSLNFDVKEEFILVSPSLKNLLPKIGDIIAFKVNLNEDHNCSSLIMLIYFQIIQISENYTPEVSSSYIIGKVMEFKTESKIVLYKILRK